VGGRRRTGEPAHRRPSRRRHQIWQVDLESFVRKSGLLARYCEEIGRGSDAVTRTHGPDCRLFDTDAQARAWCAEPDGGNLWGGEPVDTYVRDNLVGTPEQVTEKAQAYIDAGCSEFILWLRDFPGERDRCDGSMTEVGSRSSDRPRVNRVRTIEASSQGRGERARGPPPRPASW